MPVHGTPNGHTVKIVLRHWCGIEILDVGGVSNCRPFTSGPFGVIEVPFFIIRIKPDAGVSDTTSIGNEFLIHIVDAIGGGPSINLAPCIDKHMEGAVIIGGGGTSDGSGAEDRVS